MLSAALLALATSLLGALAPGSATAATPRILIVGDSLSAGYGIRQDAAWPQLLARRLGGEYSVVNASISGETTAGGRSRLPALLRQHAPAVVLIALGANDGLRGLSLVQMRDNLQAMVAAARGAGARVPIAGMRMPPNYGAYADAFFPTFGDVARRERVPLIPFLLDGIAERSELFQADGLHPTAEAQARILDNVWPALAPLIRGASARQAAAR